MNIFKNYVIGNELFVDEINWNEIQSNYSQEKIIQELSDAIVEFDIELPYRKISFDDMVEEYNELKNIEPNSLFKSGKWVSKFEYKYPFIDYYIDNSIKGNKASDYFHQIERWKCDATGYPSPQKTWENERFRLTLFKALFSLKCATINPTILRKIIGLRKYIASQFRPSAAKAIYEHFNAETVLDFSAGWGDRILGAHVTGSLKKYIGIDPNRNLFYNYWGQIKTYNMLAGNKDYKLVMGCAEDETIIIDDEVDLVFTSPPYYDKEKYDHSENQSFKKHKKFDVWLHNFLYKSIDLRTKHLKSGGHLVINISDIYTRKKLYKICDNMNDYISSRGDFEYVGAIGLKMPKRPQSISSETVGVYGEPLWLWKKK